MQTNTLKSHYNKMPSSKVTTNCKTIVNDGGKNFLKGVLSQTETGTKDLANHLTDSKEVDRAISCKEFSPQADTLHKLLVKKVLSSKYMLKKFTLKVSEGKTSAFKDLDYALQERVLSMIDNYLRKGIRILIKLFKILKWSYIGLTPIIIAYNLYKIYKSKQREREFTQIILTTGLGSLGGFIGSKIGALLGTFGGPIGIVAGAIVGGIIGGLIGLFCGKGLFKSACKCVFPNSAGGPGQPPVKGMDHSNDQPVITGIESIFQPPNIGCEMTIGQPKILGADDAFGLPKLW